MPALLKTLPDPRGRKGRRHPLAAVLAGAVCGILTGARGAEAIAEWVRNQEPKIWHLLGFYRTPPCGNTYRMVLALLPPEVFEDMIHRWIDPLMPAPAADGPPQAVSVDGKSLRGTLNEHQRSVHLLALFDQRTGGVLRQLKMPPETNEHKAALALLKSIVLKGRLITGDAIFCQREVCQQIVDDGGDYLIVVKENQAGLLAAIQAEFQPGFSPL